MTGSPPPRILRTEALTSGVIMHLDRMAIVEELIPIVFPGRETVEEIPAGAVLEQWQGRFDRWHLILRQESLEHVRPSVLLLYIKAGVVDPLGAIERERQQQRRETQSRAWFDAYHPVLGRTPREELAHPGWRIARGHLIWAGTDPHDYHTSIQFRPLSESESVNNDIIYYLERGLSLSDSVDAAIRTGMAHLRAAAFIAAGAGELANIELERAEARDDAQVMRLIEAELTADRLAIERALDAGVRKSP